MKALAWLLLFPVAIILHLGTTTTAVLAVELPEIGLQVTVLGLQGFIKTHPNLSCCNEHGACFFCVQYSKNELCFSNRLQSDRRCKYFQTRLDKHSEKQIYVFCSTISKYVSFQGTLTAENFDVLKFISGIQRNHSSIPYEIRQSKI